MGRKRTPQEARHLTTAIVLAVFVVSAVVALIGWLVWHTFLLAFATLFCFLGVVLVLAAFVGILAARNERV